MITTNYILHQTIMLGGLTIQGVQKKRYDNFRKWTPILTIFSPLEPEIYDA